LASFLAILEDRRQQALERAVGLQGAVHGGHERLRGRGLGPLYLRDVLRREVDLVAERLLRQSAIQAPSAKLGAEEGGAAGAGVE
jgi:hypothetical protein